MPGKIFCSTLFAIFFGFAQAHAQGLISLPAYSDIDWCAWENIPEEEAKAAYDRFEASTAAISEAIRQMQNVRRAIQRSGGPKNFDDLTIAVTVTRNLIVLEAAWYRQARILDCLAEKLEAYIVAREKRFGDRRGGRGGRLLGDARDEQARLAEIRRWLDGFRGLVDADGNPAVIIDGTTLILPIEPGGQGGLAYPGGGPKAGTRYAPFWNPIDKRWVAVPAGPQNPIDRDRYAQLDLLMRGPHGRDVAPPDEALYLHSRLLERSLPADPSAVAPIGDPWLFVLKGGLGVNLPAGDSALDPFNQAIARDPGFAARLSGGVVWPDALGSVDVGLDLVGIYGRTNNDELRNLGGGGVNISGSTQYVGLLPFLSLEFPIFDWSAFVGGGFGVGHQWMDLTVGGVSQATASGTGWVGQLGGGVWAPLGRCTDVGIEGYYTIFDDIDGRTAGGTPFELDGAEDITIMLSLRQKFSGPLGEPFAPILDTQAFATCP